MGNKIVHIDENKKTVSVDGTEYDLTPGIYALIMLKHLRAIKAHHLFSGIFSTQNV